MVLDISLVSNSCLYSYLLRGAPVLIRIHSSCDFQAGYHVNIGQGGPWPKRKAFAPLDQKWEAAIKRLSFLGVSARDNSKQWEIRRLSQFFCFGIVVIKYSLVPISPACNWGQRPVLESVLPLVRLRQWCLEGNPLGFGCNELRGIGNSYRPEEIRCCLFLDRNKDFSG
jgi:hypothetical protein